MTETTQVVFMPSGQRGELPLGATVLEASRTLGVDLNTVCGGRAVCGRCQIVPSHGEFAKLQIRCDPGHLSEPSFTKGKYNHIKGLKNERWLGCQSRTLGDTVIDIPEESQIHPQVETVETAIAEDFQDYFAAAMSLPHGADPFPKLAASLETQGLARR